MLLRAFIALTLAAFAAGAGSAPHGAKCTPTRIVEDVFKQHQGGVLMLNDVCLDGDTIVVHDPRRLDSFEGGEGGGLPSFDTIKFQEFHKHYSHNPHPLRPILGSNCNHHPLRFRYPSALEVRRAKHFSNCTVPLLIFSHWIHAYAEYFTRPPAWMWVHMVRDQSIDKELTLVLASCGSIPLGQHHMQLLQPFSNHQVTSWTTFASRANSHSHSNSTAEGTHTRCFSRMMVMGMDHAGWAYTYYAAEYIIDHYQKRNMIPKSTLFKTGPGVLKIMFEYRSPNSQVHIGSTVHNVEPFPANHSEVNKLRSHAGVDEPPEFRHRPVYPGVRQILNLADVIKECNTPTSDWVTQVLKGTNYTGVECQAYSFGRDLLEGIAVAQQTDVFISLHGSGEMNAMFLKRNSIKIQMRSKEFGTLHRYMSNGYWPLVCHQNNFPYQCWFLNFDEEDTWEPGILERFKMYGEGKNEGMTRRDRHLRLKFSHLVHALKEILPVQYNREEFLKRWDAAQVAITFNENKTITYFKQISKRRAGRRLRLESEPQGGQDSWWGAGSGGEALEQSTAGLEQVEAQLGQLPEVFRG